MYYAIAFHEEEGRTYQYALRSKGFKTIVAAKTLIIKSGKKGFVKKLGETRPVWENIL